MRAIRTQVKIRATIEPVWAILRDFAAFPRWNPFVQLIEGKPAEGERLAVRIGSANGRAMTFKPRVLKADAGREQRWLGRLAISGLFSGEHSFTIEKRGPDQVRFAQAESFRGLLVPLMWNSLDRDTKAGFTAMNQALKARAERPSCAPGPWPNEGNGPFGPPTLKLIASESSEKALRGRWNGGGGKVAASDA